MEDQRISALLLARDETAIAACRAAYEQDCFRIAMNILENRSHAEQCVEDVFRQAETDFFAFPPEDPAGSLYRLTRTLALDRYRLIHTAKHGNCLFAVTLYELGECLPSLGSDFDTSLSGEGNEAVLGDCINRFLRKERGEARELFICRYFYGESVLQLTSRFGLTEKQVGIRLRRTRLRLRTFLEKEGLRV